MTDPDRTRSVTILGLSADIMTCLTTTQNWDGPVGQRLTRAIGGHNTFLYQTLAHTLTGVEPSGTLRLFATNWSAVTSLTPGLPLDDLLGWVFLHTRFGDQMPAAALYWAGQAAPDGPYWFAAGYSPGEAAAILSPDRAGPVPSKTELRALAAIRGILLPEPAPETRR